MSVCPTLCPTGSIRPAGGRRLKTEAPVGEIPPEPKKSLLAATGFTRQAMGIRLGRGSLYRRPRSDQQGVDNDLPYGLSGKDMYELTTTTPGGDPSGPCQAKRGAVG